MTSRLLLCLLITLPLLTLLPSGVVGHAKLVSPQPWNTKSSKTQICGGPTNPANFKVTPVIPGQNLAVQWTVEVGDGVGSLSAAIDTKAKSNPTTNDFALTLTPVDTTNKINRVGTYTIQIPIPSNLVCTGPGGTCSLRVISQQSGWVACATISVQGATPAPTPAPTKAPTYPPTAAPTGSTTTTTSPPVVTDAPTSAPTDAPVLADNFVPYPALANPCVVATGLVTCSSVNGQSVQLTGPSLNIIDANVQDQINFALTNVTVLTTPNVAGCQQAFTDLLCAQAFPACTMTVPMICTSTCQRVKNLCIPNATLYQDGTSHAQLYDCANTQLGFTQIGKDTTGNCPDVTTGVRPTTTVTEAPATTPTPTPKPGTKNHGDSIHSSILMVSLTIVLAMIGHCSL